MPHGYEIEGIVLFFGNGKASNGGNSHFDSIIALYGKIGLGVGYFNFVARHIFCQATENRNDYFHEIAGCRRDF